MIPASPLPTGPGRTGDGSGLQVVPDTLPEQPLPGGVADAVRFFFEVPQWIQIGGAVVGVLLALAAVVLLWRHRQAGRRWIETRSRTLQVTLGAVVVVALLAATYAGRESWDYMQHDNDFCTGCHVMGPAFQRFAESEHSQLECHDCHRQSIIASARQLYLWVLERPEEIGEHAPVPNQVCAECHIREDPGNTWQRISATAGHRVHLESDSAALAGVACVTCHGQEVHEFVPADQTCGQAGCHAPATTRIALGEMAGQTGFHCLTCHEFTAPVEEEVPRDTALAELVPGSRQCLSCHEMEALVAAFTPTSDPHGGRCGACHNPHEQAEPAAASATCTEAGCHEEPAALTGFHRGLQPGVLETCLRCHEVHEWTVEGENCGGCHSEIPGATAGASTRSDDLPARVATMGGEASGTSALRSWIDGGRLSASVSLMHGGGATTGWNLQEAFSHREHASVECVTCHTSEERHGAVAVGAGDCFSCHHSDEAARVGCGGCHRPGELGAAGRVQVTMALEVWEAPRARRLPVDHAVHREVACGACHGQTVTTVPGAVCTNCHAEHHDEATNCSVCHEVPPADAHTVEVHVTGCQGSGCHGPSAYRAMKRDRRFCLACHLDRPGPEHHPDQPCVRCHLVPTGGQSGEEGGGA